MRSFELLRQSVAHTYQKLEHYPSLTSF